MIDVIRFHHEKGFKLGKYFHRFYISLQAVNLAEHMQKDDAYIIKFIIGCPLVLSSGFTGRRKMVLNYYFSLSYYR